jgi:hypothetical protein
MFVGQNVAGYACGHALRTASVPKPLSVVFGRHSDAPLRWVCVLYRDFRLGFGDSFPLPFEQHLPLEHATVSPDSRSHQFAGALFLRYARHRRPGRTAAPTRSNRSKRLTGLSVQLFQRPRVSHEPSRRHYRRSVRRVDQATAKLFDVFTIAA